MHRGCSSDGRASDLHSEGHGFDPRQLHFLLPLVMCIAFEFGITIHFGVSSWKDLFSPYSYTTNCFDDEDEEAPWQYKIDELV